MGGLLDATNLIRKPLVSVLTSISMDHMQFLGKTIAKIAEQKAGIIKAGCPVVSAAQKEEAACVIAQEAAKKKAPLSVADVKNVSGIRYGIQTQSFHYGGYRNLKISLGGVCKCGRMGIPFIRHFFRCSGDAIKKSCKQRLGDHFSIHHEPLPIRKDRRRRIASHTVPCLFQDRSQIGKRRSLSVRAGDMDNGNLLLRITQPPA